MEAVARACFWKKRIFRFFKINLFIDAAQPRFCRIPYIMLHETEAQKLGFKSHKNQPPAGLSEEIVLTAIARCPLVKAQSCRTEIKIFPSLRKISKNCAMRSSAILSRSQRAIAQISAISQRKFHGTSVRTLNSSIFEFLHISCIRQSWNGSTGKCFRVTRMFRAFLNCLDCFWACLNSWFC